MDLRDGQHAQFPPLRCTGNSGKLEKLQGSQLSINADDLAQNESTFLQGGYIGDYQRGY